MGLTSECIPTSYPRMLKACSEMGTTLYELHWSSVPFQEQEHAGRQGDARAEYLSTEKSAFVVPVTLKLQSPWHMIHSLVPAYAQIALDSRYGLLNTHRDLDLIIIDQDLDKDRH